ncbi:hypothetical protein RSOLAG22IIIB_11560 [Rhizoctonia solani]|uniref:Protein kinase domain-containing protein n=1 Tax=Rhizoctonia solani TaxID=456999 RepID=A0A0K6G8E3_9AGAM|nr:hypothetical protein RSOLAG22IIIB_11560 [Rhizoctonia solani]
MDNCAHLIDRHTKLPSCEFEKLSSERGGRADIVFGKLKFVVPDRKVAVKAFRVPESNEKAIKNEMEIWRLVNNHAHINSFIGMASVDDPRYFPTGPVSDHYTQGNLKAYLARQDPDVLDCSLRFRLLLNVIEGLKYVHSQAIVHGDLKAMNVLVDGNNKTPVARICDFGSSSINCPCYTGPRGQQGTIPWDSPELWMPADDDDDDDDDEKEAPARTTQSDIWAFGCVALEVQMGFMPWEPGEEDKAWSMTGRQCEAGDGPPAEASDIRLKLEADPIKQKIWDLMVQCWSPDPQGRPAADQLSEAMMCMN